MQAFNTVSELSQIEDIIEEYGVAEIPAFFISRLYKYGEVNKDVAKEFLWWARMNNLFRLQLSLGKFSDSEKTISEMEEKFGASECFQKLRNEVFNHRRNSTFIYNGRDNVTWDELPLEVKKHDYPYYFNEYGEDCFPYVQKEE